MDQSKKGFLPVLQGVKLSQTQCPTTSDDRDIMKVIPYALAIGSITTKKYTSVMIRVCYSRSLFLSCMYIHDDFMTESR